VIYRRTTTDCRQPSSPPNGRGSRTSLGAVGHEKAFCIPIAPTPRVVPSRQHSQPRSPSPPRSVDRHSQQRLPWCASLSATFDPLNAFGESACPSPPTAYRQRPAAAEQHAGLPKFRAAFGGSAPPNFRCVFDGRFRAREPPAAFSLRENSVASSTDGSCVCRFRGPPRPQILGPPRTTYTTATAITAHTAPDSHR